MRKKRIIPFVQTDKRMLMNFEFLLFPKRPGLDMCDTTVATHIIQDKNRLTVIFRTGEMQFSTSYIGYNYAPKLFKSLGIEIHSIVRAFCKEYVQDIMKYDDIACANAAQFGLIGICNPKNIEILKKFHHEITHMFKIRLENELSLAEKKDRRYKDMMNDYEYTSLTL